MGKSALQVRVIEFVGRVYDAIFVAFLAFCCVSTRVRGSRLHAFVGHVLPRNTGAHRRELRAQHGPPEREVIRSGDAVRQRYRTAPNVRAASRPCQRDLEGQRALLVLHDGESFARVEPDLGAEFLNFQNEKKPQNTFQKNQNYIK